MRRAAIAFIFVTVVIDVLAMGIVIPVLPRLVEAFEGGDTARAAETFGVFGTAWGLMQFIFMPLIGALSDRFGRRPVILISCFGLGIDFFVMALAPSLGWLFVGRIVSGITASGFATAFAYIADVTPPEKRAAGFGMVGAAFGLGFVIGPALGGTLGEIDPRLPFRVAGALAIVNACYGFFVLPESLPPEKRAAFSWKKANPVGSLVLLRSHPELSGLAVSHFLMQLAHVVLPSVTVLYMGYRYGWSALQVGLTLAAVGVCSMIVQGGLVRPVVARLGERRALALGLFFGAVGFSWYGLASTGAWFLAGVPLMALWGFANPSLQALMTRRVSHSEQGQLQGANSSLTALAGIFGPSLFSQLFSSFIGPHAPAQVPGAAFLAAASMLVASLAVGWYVTRAR
ncbi:MAG TPA: TCR/Tet family MFS transporter [Usitatibacter sp.]|nr:TCR/Tet family MFS transporter [Usitatibacter sp.]